MGQSALSALSPGPSLPGIRQRLALSGWRSVTKRELRSLRVAGRHALTQVRAGIAGTQAWSRRRRARCGCLSPGPFRRQFRVTRSSRGVASEAQSRRLVITTRHGELALIQRQSELVSGSDQVGPSLEGGQGRGRTAEPPIFSRVQSSNCATTTSQVEGKQRRQERQFHQQPLKEADAE